MYDEDDRAYDTWAAEGDIPEEIDHDHCVLDTPIMTAHLRRNRETVTVSAYTEPRMVVLTYPRVPLGTSAEMTGCVRELHVGSRANIEDRFAAEVLRLWYAQWTAERVDAWRCPEWLTEIVRHPKNAAL